MAVTDFKLVNIEGAWELEKYRKTYKHEWIVVSNLSAESEDTVLAVTPAIGSTHNGAWCVRKSAKQRGVDDTGYAYVWSVILDYDTVLPFDPVEYTQNPIIRPLKFSYDTENTTEAFWEARSPNPDSSLAATVNKAGAPFIPPLERDRATGIIKIEHNRATVPPIGLYINRINSNVQVFDGFSYPAYTLRCTGFSAERIYEGTFGYVKANIVVKYNPAGHKIKVLNAGLYELVDVSMMGGAHYRNIKGRDGTDVSQPFPLGLDGKKLPDGGTINFIDFWAYELVSFAGILS